MFAGNWVPELVSMAGGEDIFAVPGSHSGVIEWDQIRLEDPDIIVLMPCGYDLPRTQEELPLISESNFFEDTFFNLRPPIARYSDKRPKVNIRG